MWAQDASAVVRLCGPSAVAALVAIAVAHRNPAGLAPSRRCWPSRRIRFLAQVSHRPPDQRRCPELRLPSDVRRYRGLEAVRQFSLNRCSAVRRIRLSRPVGVADFTTAPWQYDASCPMLWEPRSASGQRRQPAVAHAVCPSEASAGGMTADLGNMVGRLSVSTAAPATATSAQMLELEGSSRGGRRSRLIPPPLGGRSAASSVGADSRPQYKPVLC